jgi:hypothetical protein
MKNKPVLALLRPSKLSNEIKKRVQKSRETIPLSDYYVFPVGGVVVEGVAWVAGLAALAAMTGL